MSKITVQAREIQAAEVTRLSLVKRGANMLPFRILKSDKGSDMNIDLGSMFSKSGRPSAVNTAAFVSAVVVPKEFISDENIAMVTKTMGGEPLQKMDAADGSLILQYREADGDAHPLKLTKHVGALVCGYEKAFGAWNPKTSFGEAIEANTFYPGVSVAMDTFYDTVHAIAATADDPDSMSSMVKSAADEFADYVTSLTKALPKSAFELELLQFAQKAEAAPAAPAAPIAPVVTPDIEPTKDVVDAAALEKGDDIIDPIDAFKHLMAESMGELRTALVGELDTRIAPLNKRLDEVDASVETALKKADTLGNAVSTALGSDDVEPDTGILLKGQNAVGTEEFWAGALPFDQVLQS
jgi:hypothetical protein